ASFIAVTITPPDWPTQLTDDTDRRAIEEYIRRAEDLGAETLRIEGHDVANELARAAVESHVTPMVIVEPRHTRGYEQLFVSVVARFRGPPLAADMPIVRARESQARR